MIMNMEKLVERELVRVSEAVLENQPTTNPYDRTWDRSWAVAVEVGN
jgi:hypothetical protein